MTLRCAVYARISTDRQNPLSIDDQIHKCSEFAKPREWKVLEDHVYRDEAISGTTDDRPGLQRLFSALKIRPCPFDVLLVDDTSRLSRKTRDALGIFERLNFAGVRLISISQGIDSDNEQADVLVQVHGLVDSLYVKELATKTRRGMDGAFRRGMHAGGRCFGYRNVPIEAPGQVDEHGRPVILGVRLAINEEQAAIVRRIFELYANGSSLKGIAKCLNAEGVKSPQPQQGRISQSWCPSSIRVILRNDRYRGLVIWGKTRKVRSEAGRKVYRRRDKSEWVMRDTPEQRIVSDELWSAAQARKDLVKLVYEGAGDRAGRLSGLLSSSAMNAPYLFSGLLKCKTCGANLQVVSRRGPKEKRQTYGCPLNFNRGEAVCTNGVRVRRDVLERELLAGLQDKVLREDVVNYILDQFEEKLTRELENIGGEMDGMKRRKVELEGEIHRLVTGLAKGVHSPAIMSEITDREREISDISDRLLSSKPESIRSRIAALRETALARIRDLRHYLNSDPATARAYLTKHVEQIVMDATGGVYVASGSWSLLGDRYAGMVPGGRVELPTPAFSGPRSTGELPRHLCNQKIVRAGSARSKGVDSGR
jgi:site-specific DNA recombinase